MSNKKTYQDYVNLGRDLLKSVTCYQVHIAYFATQICTIRHGGRSNGYYTLKDYARDIGMNGKTLSEWVIVYKGVISKLGIDLDEITAKDWEVANRVINILKNEKRAINELSGKVQSKDKGWRASFSADKIKDLFKQNYDKRSIQIDIMNWTDYMVFIKNRLISRDLSEASTSSLLSLKENMDKASDVILDHLMNKRKESLTELTETSFRMGITQ